MRKSCYSAELIIGILRQHNAGASVVTPRGRLRRLKLLEAENAHMK